MRSVSIKNKDGSVLVVVLLVMAVLMILVVGVMTISMSEERTSIYQENKIEAHFLALSGAKTTSEWLLQNPARASEFIGATSQDKDFGNGTFQVEINTGATAEELVILSSAEVSNVKSSVSVTLSSLSSAMMLDKAIYTHAALDLSNMNVTGDVQSGDTVTVVTNGHNAYDGEATQNTPMVYQLEPFPSYPPDKGNLTVNGDVEITANSQYTNITINNNGVLTLKPQGTIMKVVIDTLDITGSLDIDTSLGGRVEIYITNGMYISTQGLINNTYPYKLFIFIADGKVFDMAANMELNGYIIAPNAEIYLQSDQSTINGAVIGNILKKNGVVNAPNGTINYYPLPADIDISDSLSGYRIVKWEND